MSKRASKDIQAIFDKVLDACMTACMNTSDDLQSTGRDTVREWKNKPDFGETVYNGLDRIEFVIKPKGNKRVIQIFQYVDKGTKPHIIMPKIKGGMLKFRLGYSARTMPVAKYNIGTGQSFGAWVTKQQVFHPGSKPRNFLEHYLKELIPSFQQRIQMEINKAIA